MLALGKVVQTLGRAAQGFAFEGDGGLVFHQSRHFLMRARQVAQKLVQALGRVLRRRLCQLPVEESFHVGDAGLECPRSCAFGQPVEAVGGAGRNVGLLEFRHEPTKPAEKLGLLGHGHVRIAERHHKPLHLVEEALVARPPFGANLAVCQSLLQLGAQQRNHCEFAGVAVFCSLRAARG